MKKGKKILLALLCIIPMVISAIPASAMEHGCIAIDKPGTKEYQNSYKEDGDGHLSRYRVQQYCQTCYRDMGFRDGDDKESHSWGYYDDMGHMGESHLYKVYCGKCNASKSVLLICYANLTGKHNTP